MKAQIIRQFGGPEVFEEADVPTPEVLEGHVLIRVAATSVNPVDCRMRQNGPPFAPDLPAVLHGDAAGLVEEVGDGVRGFKLGDEVYACAGGVKGTGGALAKFMLADADLLAKKPHTLSMAEAAALPLVSITAWEGLIDRAMVRPGQNVLVHGGTGGVGHVGVQIAKQAGARVLATGSSQDKLRIAKDLGADETIDYRERSVEEYVAEHTDGKGFDIVFDTVGGENLYHSFEATRLNGTVVSISTGREYDLSLMYRKGLTLHVVAMLIPIIHGTGRARYGQILSEVAALADSGRLRPLIDERRFRFSEVAEAHRLLESGRAVGKVVLSQ